MNNTDRSREREALTAYLADCEANAIVPDVGGAWHAAFQAGRASLSANAASITSETGNSVSAQGPAITSESLTANAGEPVAHLWQHCETGRTRIVMPDMIVDADASWQVVGPLYLGAAPPTAQAEGWISVDERLPDEAQAYGRESDDCLVELPNKRFTCAMVVRTTSGPKWLDQDSRVVYPVRWMRIPPTSAEGVEP